MGDTAETAQGETRLSMILTMAQYFEHLGYTDIRARAVGYKPPIVIAGMVEDHRPDITCRQRNYWQSQIILDVAAPEVIDASEFRYQLFVSAAQRWQAELHLAATAADRCTNRVRGRLALMGLVVNKIWEL